MALRKKSGFTLVELLVVISIIGMLMALLLPAVNSVRENARRTTCANQMRQIAMATFNYVSSKGSFPGYRGNRAGTGSTPATLDTSWFVAIAPQFERSDIKDRYESLVKAPNLFPYIELAVCPSDPAEQLTPAPNNPISHLSYVVNAGRFDNPFNVQNPPPDNAANGVFHDLRHPRTEKLTIPFRDGIGNTLMLSENNQATYWSHTGPNDQILETEVSFLFEHRKPEFDPNTGEPRVEATRINGLKNDNQVRPRPSSNHPGGVNVAFCDARTMFLREDIAYRVLQQLMTPDGFNRNCDVPGNGPNGPEFNKAYILNSADYSTQ